MDLDDKLEAALTQIRDTTPAMAELIESAADEAELRMVEIFKLSLSESTADELARFGKRGLTISLCARTLTRARELQQDRMLLEMTVPDDGPTQSPKRKRK